MATELTDTAMIAADSPHPRVSPAPLRRYLHPIVLGLLLVVAAVLRFYDLNWDQSQYNHPDERHVTNVVSALRMPDSLGEYFDSARSPLNPYNIRQSWVYGTLPLFGGRALAEFLDEGCAPTRALIPRVLGQLLFAGAAADCTRGFFTGYEYIRLVGRLLSALADVITVVVVYLTGRRLFGWRVGLLAAMFSAFTVLQIQHSKFFVVESLLTMCVAWCLYFCARIATTAVRSRRSAYGLWGSALLAGAFSGLAVACKVSAWPTAGLVVLAILIAMMRDRRTTSAAVLTALAASVIAGVAAFAGFRITQPYGFVGGSAVEWAYTIRACDEGLDALQAQICLQTPPMPDALARIVMRLPDFLRPLLAPSARWIAELQMAAAQSNGIADPPWGWQWANRPAIIFPLTNLVFYGMGVPLGVAAVVGVLYTLRRLLLGRRWYAYLIPAVWTIGFFLYQGTQFVKSIRYLLPIYPMLCIAAAALLIALWRNWQPALPSSATGEPPVKRHIRARLRSAVPAVMLSFVLGGTIVWALAFMNIYTGELTRTEASRWIYAHVPTAITLSGRDEQRVRHIQLPVTEVVLQPGASFSAVFRVDEVSDRVSTPLDDVRLTFNYLEGSGGLEARLVNLRTQAEVAAVQGEVAPMRATIGLEPARIEPGVDYLLELKMPTGLGIRARTSVIANQHFDEGIPFRIAGKDGFGSYYRGLSTAPGGEMPVYNEDDPAKLEVLLDGLDEADYLVLNSNRHYGSVARLPWRFPITNAYYRALMGGELGFELVADFHRFPRIGPFMFNDQEMPQRLQRSPQTDGSPPGIEVPYPPAEEAFSVYDHPRVLIFKKTSQYTRAGAERILTPYSLVRTVRQTAFQASDTPGGLLLDQKTLAAQRAGGTWSELFPRASLLNQSQVLAVVAWVALIEALGIAAFMLIAVTARRRASSADATHVPALADGGYAFGKALGLVLVSFAAWWLGSLKIAPFSPGMIWFLVVALIGGAALVGHLNRDFIFALVRGRWPVMIAGEALFLIAFIFFLLIRAGNPDLWHPFFGGEKPMDFAYLNSVLKATYFPPQDPWFAGGAINYYYFGFVFIGTPIKALGIDPAVAYNIAIPTLFAMTACGAFGLGASFYASRAGLTANAIASPSTRRLKRAVVTGLIAAIFAVFIGNGDQIRVVGPAWQTLGGIEHGVASPRALVSGVLRWLGGAPLPIAPWWPYWNPTRPAPEVMIAEFPHFTFLYADLHAHMMAMPIAYLALALALAFACGARGWPALTLGAIATGMLWPTNAWDYPPYLLLGIAGLLLGSAAQAGAAPGRAQRDALMSADLPRIVAGALPAIVIFTVLTRLVMAPYLVHYGAAYNTIDRWEGDRTPLNTYITIYGLFLIPIGFYLLRGALVGAGRIHHLTRIAAVCGLIAGVLLAARGVPIALIAAPITVLALATAVRPNTTPPTRLLWLMTAGAFALTLFVEVFTLRGDIGRMNTQFKFYIQVWLMLSVAAAVTLMWVLERLLMRERSDERALPRRSAARLSIVAVRFAFTAAAAIAFFLALLYPVFAIPAKVGDRYTHDAPRGLDGMAFMRYAMRSEEYAGRQIEFELRHDYDAIRWMQDHVVGSPTLIEEGAAGGNQYRWSARFAIYTGLPTVVGWEWHQRQQRAAMPAPVVEDRVADVHTFYSTTDVELARALLRRYEVRYVVVGAMERLYNDPAGFDKFDLLVEAGDLRIAYQNPGVTIYEVSF